MENVKSRYNFFALALLIGLNAGWILMIVLTGYWKSMMAAQAWENGTHIAVNIFLILFQILLLVLLATQSPLIVIKAEGIECRNLLLPFVRKVYKWSDFDGYYTVDEQSRGGTNEAVWLVRNRKIKKRISSFYYSNYQHLKASLLIPSKDKLHIHPFKQLYCLLGGSI